MGVDRVRTPIDKALLVGFHQQMVIFLEVQCNLGVVACTHKCAEGIQMNCSLFFLNQLLEYSLVAQVGKPFSYSWLLILISLVTWMEPKDYQPMAVDAAKVFQGA